jgi:alanyl-tRNA synthetase
MVTDHFLSIFLLCNEGIEPSNKSSGYVLRKMIRKMVTEVWLLTSPGFHLDQLANNLSSVITSYDRKTSSKVKSILNKEVAAMQAILRTAKKIAHQHQELSNNYIYETYGVSVDMMAIARKEI